MRTLYHFPLHPASRQARIALAEKKLKIREEVIDPWNPSDEFLDMTAEGAPPVFVDVISGGTITISGVRAICEYANDGSTRLPLLSDHAFERAEARRICAWFETRFSEDVDSYILSEKVEKTVTGLGAPETAVLREGREHLQFHLTYLTWLLERRDWLAGNQFSLGDIAGAGHISCLDFLGEMKWRDWPAVKDWYQRIKSRPSMRGVLNDRVPGFRAPRHYTDLDF
ncbi:glutathione S-transferase family protein [Litorimonas sp. RW-G-Af-16]|uniref:glutathione S-transferase family protein n=1 Tax=Litorimonas sp. RW-G-Af-16 TaxID=3241168 RepID=UPI00390CBD25